MGTFLRRAGAPVLALLLFTATASAGDALTALGPVFDITHFDVLPVTSPFNSERIAYKALFKFRADSKSDTGSQSFRIINWQPATNHSFIVDVWSTYQAFERHLAQPDSVKFRFSVQDLPPPDTGCCIGSPIDDRQYRLIETIGIPWTSDKLPVTAGPKGALWVVTYVDFLQELLQDLGGNAGQQRLVRYGAASLGANKGRLLDYTVLQQLARPNRYVLLQVWDTEKSYDLWASSAVTTDFVSKLAPLLGSPLDIRLNNLCGKTYVVGTGCTSP